MLSGAYFTRRVSLFSHAETFARKMFDEPLSQASLKKLMQSEEGRRILTQFMRLKEHYDKLPFEEQLRFRSEFDGKFEAQFEILEKSYDSSEAHDEIPAEELTTYLIFIILLCGK